jgi:cobalt-zinc-cadmium efflux system outer membrane protein
VLDRAAVARCAAEHAPPLAAGGHRIAAAREGLGEARARLPDSPSVAVTVAHRRSAVDEDVNFYTTLGQELEIGGQRGRRLAAATAEHAREQALAAAGRREAAAAALLAYYDVLAASDARTLLDRGLAIAEALSSLTQARAESGLAAGIDAQLAAAEVARLRSERALAGSRREHALASLAWLVGRDPGHELRLAGELEPLRVDPSSLARLLDDASEGRPELAATRHGRDALRARSELERRALVPNPTLSATVQRDGFAETVIGGGIAFPIPLAARAPRARAARVGALARAAQAQLDAERGRVRADVTGAARGLAELSLGVDHEGPDPTAVEPILGELAREIESGRLGPREALAMQRTLVDALRVAVEARWRVCTASVELAHAAGLRLEELAR